MALLKKYKHLLEWQLFLLVRATVPSRNFVTAQKIGKTIGKIAFHLLNRERKLAIYNLKNAFPDLPSRWHKAIALGAFVNAGINLAEILYISKNGIPEKHLTIENGEELLSTKDKGKGIALVTAHLGNWELINFALEKLGIQTFAIVRKQSNPYLSNFLFKFRTSTGCQIINRGEENASKLLLKAIKSNSCIVSLIDQSIKANNCEVIFFGRKAPTPLFPAKLVINHGMLPAVALSQRTPTGTHRIRFLTYSIFPDKAEAIMQTLTTQIEKAIRATPSQWVWFHNRWRVQS